jgi:nucleotide-binding universal stress UspA family protein
MKILVAIDQSTYSTKALEQAVEMARDKGAELTALTVAEMALGIEDLSPESSIEDKLLELAQATSDKAKEYARGKGVSLKAVVESSLSVGESILVNAEKLGADLIVMGSHGKKGLERFLLGSVASKVVAHANCSVLVVR